MAITTTFGKLDEVVTNGEKKWSNIIGLAGVARVRYFDYVNEGLIDELAPGERFPNSLTPFMLKNVSYEHEKEVRALLIAKLGEAEFTEEGVSIEVEVRDFIDEIIVIPFSKKWFSRTVSDLAYKYELHGKIRQSSLSPDVFYEA